MSEPPLVVAFYDEALEDLDSLAGTLFGTTHESVHALATLFTPVCRALAAYVNGNGAFELPDGTRLAAGDPEDPARSEITVKDTVANTVCARLVFGAHAVHPVHTVMYAPSGGTSGWWVYVAHLDDDVITDPRSDAPLER